MEKVYTYLKNILQPWKVQISLFAYFLQFRALKLSLSCCDRPRESVLEPLKIVVFDIFSNEILWGTNLRLIIIFCSTCKWSVIFHIFDNFGPSEYSTPLRDKRFVTHNFTHKKCSKKALFWPFLGMMMVLWMSLGGGRNFCVASKIFFRSQNW